MLGNDDVLERSDHTDAGRKARGTPLLEMREITKEFPGAKALDSVSFLLNAGEVHALVGANGAGKSTLMKVLGGVYRDYLGRIVIDGVDQRITSPRVASDLGIAVIHQEFNLVHTLTVAENIFLGREPRRCSLRGAGPFIDWRRLYSDAEAFLAELGFSKVAANARLSDLGVADQQLVQIAKAISEDARILVMDEPTARLSRAERDELFGIIRRLRGNGTGIVYISHFLDEVFAVADRVTVLRDGRVVHTGRASDLTRRDLIRLMLGRDVEAANSGEAERALSDRHREQGPGGEALRVEGLSCPGKFEDVSFTLLRGEILGISGLVGAGRTELVRALFGADGRVFRGRVFIGGRECPPASPGRAIRHGLALVPEDRKRQGLVLVRPVSDNVLLAVCGRLTRFRFLDHKRRAEVVDAMTRRLRIKCPSPAVAANTLSGGNQQKTVLAKWLAAAPKVLMLDQPTAGIDVGTKEEIYGFLHELAAAGSALIVVSDDPGELARVCDRILVMHRGRIVKELAGPTTSREVLAAVTANY